MSSSVQNELSSVIVAYVALYNYRTEIYVQRVVNKVLLKKGKKIISKASQFMIKMGRLYVYVQC